MIYQTSTSQTAMLSEGSEHSTGTCMDANDAIKQPLQQVSFRRVRLAPVEDIETFERNSQFEDIPVNELWYSPEDYKEFRTNFKDDAKMVAKDTKQAGVSKAMNQLFQECCNLSDDLATTSSNDAVLEFLQDANNTGMHRMASREIFTDKNKRRKALLNLVLETECFDQEDDRILRAECEDISLAAVRFAQVLAQVAVQQQ